MDTNHEMLQKSQTHDMMNSAVARGCARAFTPSSPIWFCLRSTSFMVLLMRIASARACRVGTRQRPSGQQTRGRFTAAVLNYLHCLVRMSRLSLVPTHVRSSRHHPTHSVRHISSHLHSDLLPPFFSSLSQGHSLQYLFNENKFRTTYPLRKDDKVPEGQ